MRKTTKTLTTVFASLIFAATAFAMPANAATKTQLDDDNLVPGVPYASPLRTPVPDMGPLSQADLWVAAAQYTARDGFSAKHALGAGNYTVLNMEVPGEGVPEDLSNGTCPGPIRYTNTQVATEYIAELGECGGWDRYGWLQEGNVVRLTGKVSGNYMVKDVIALGVPGNTKLSFTDTPDAVMVVNNPNAQDELYMFNLIDYTKRLAQNQPV